MKDKDKEINFESEIELFDGEEQVYEMSMEEAEAEAYDMIRDACSILGWSIAVPLTGEDTITHMIIGAPHEVQEIADGCDLDYEVYIDPTTVGEQH